MTKQDKLDALQLLKEKLTRVHKEQSIGQRGYSLCIFLNGLMFNDAISPEMAELLMGRLRETYRKRKPLFAYNTSGERIEPEHNALYSYFMWHPFKSKGYDDRMNWINATVRAVERGDI